MELFELLEKQNAKVITEETIQNLIDGRMENMEEHGDN